MAKKPIKLTNGDDVESYGKGDQVVNARGGDDIISGGAGNDTLNGGAGNDILRGGTGDDTLNGGIGDDTLLGGAGDDTLKALSGNDTVDGGEGDDIVQITGNFADATVAMDGDYYAITIGTTTVKVKNTELFKFDDGTVGTDALDDKISGTTGKTFTLTTAIDAGAAFTGTSGDDTFIGDATTASAADQISGGIGTDTLRLFGNAAEPTHSGIEIVELNGNTAGFDVSTNADVTTLNIIDATTAQTYTLANGQTASVSQMIDGETIDFAGNTVTGLNVTVNGLGTATGAGLRMDFNSTAQTSVTLTGSTAASYIDIENTGAKITTLTLAGDKALTVDAETYSVGLTTVDASTTTAGVSVILDTTTAKDVAVTGGSGNDTVNFGSALTKADKFDGGAGTDTLAITDASVATVQALSATDKATLNANLANLEVLKVTDALTNDIDASRFDAINSIVLAAGLGDALNTISSVASGVTVEIGDAAGAAAWVLAVDITNATLAGNNSDVVNVKLTDAAAAGTSDAGVLNLVGVDTVNIDTTQATGGTTTGHIIDIAATSTALDNVVVTGNTALDLSGVSLTSSLASFDASGMTLAAATSTGVTVAIATGGTSGVAITGSGGVDSLTGGDGADIIKGGAGADSITGGAGNDVLTGGDGADTFVFGATAVANGVDTISDFTAGAGNDKLDFGTNFLGTTTAAANNLTLTTSSANVALADDNVFILNTSASITAKDFGDADFAELFGAGNGQFNTTVGASTQSVVLVKGADFTQVYFVDSSLDGTATDITAADVALVGTLTATGTFATTNFL